MINVGDSRTIASKNNGKEIVNLTNDHKPNTLKEFNRILEHGGKLYRMSSNLRTMENNFYFISNYKEMKKVNEYEKYNKNLMFGPWRIKPGGLSVSRTFGDLESKVTSYGGKKGCVT